MLIRQVQNTDCKTNFKGKIATKQMVIDTHNIKSIVSAEGNKTLLKFKKAIQTAIPNEREMQNYYDTLYSIVHSDKAYTALGEHFETDYRVNPRPFPVSDKQSVMAPNKAELIVKSFKEEFWKNYSLDSVLLNINYSDFLNVYKQAIAKENYDKVFDLNC